MSSGIEMPLEVAIMLCVGFGLAGGWFGHWRTRRRLLASRDPLAEILRRENLGLAIRLAIYHDAQRRGSRPVPRDRIGRFAGARQGWPAQTAASVHEHVARVMHAGSHRPTCAAQGQDRVVWAGEIEEIMLLPAPTPSPAAGAAASAA